MHGKITVVSYDDFVDHFLPASISQQPLHSNIFSGISTPKKETDMYETLTATLNASGICPNFTFVATPHHADQTDSTKQATDCGMYPQDHAPGPESRDSSYGRVNWSWIDLSIECKTESTDQDPFDDVAADGEPTASKRRDALGQILSYAELIFKYQHRMFFFTIIFLGDYARIVRFDRSGVFATKKFNYKSDGTNIVGFLWRYSRLTDVERGHDPTVTRISPESAEGLLMKARGADAKPEDTYDFVRELFQETLDAKWPWWQIEVHSAATPARQTGSRCTVVRKYLVGKPHFYAAGVAGRGTRGYVALPIAPEGEQQEDMKFCFLKDAWRVDHDNIDQEGVTLKTLNDECIPFVPTLICHGDLPNQATQSPKYWGRHHPKVEKCALKQHTHYRLVVKEVGKPLEQFGDDSWHLMNALLCCLQAHQDAYVKAKVIHRDISAGNILLYKDDEGLWYGMLNDWELAKKIESGPIEGRQPDRTGTWQFMSVHALNDPHRRIVIQDELESIFHVLLYYAIRFVPHNLSAVNVGHFLHDYFDAYSTHNEGFRCGHAKLDAMTYGVIGLRTYNGDKDPRKTKLRFLWPSPKPTPASKPESSLQLAPPPEPESSPPPSSPSPGERKSTTLERSPSPTSSEQFGSDLVPLPSEAIPPPDEHTLHPVEPTTSPETNAPPPAPPRVHPLQQIITELLSWFQALYALDDVASKSSEEPSTSTTTGSDQQDNLSVKSPRWKRSAASRSRNSRARTTLQPSAPPDSTETERSKELREKLSTHDAMVDLFLHWVDEPDHWPCGDRTEDKRPKGGYAPPKDPMAVGSTTTGSKKRSLEGGETSTSKRTKTSSRH